ncbi:prepilin-type N-terminal cleavage/methylation domain-containing protein [Pseudohaliea sp.]|uniref:prepilin-type N-terminal cleavage/methylation domain-containing protein n=1 Tax=Pseudohaliea sp. TaxID=2740289 RepID=UPI0032EF7568
MRHQRGFSLLEMLVVLLVVVVIVSLASLNTGSGAEERRLAEEVRFLADVAAYARDEAAFSGRDHGLLLAEEQRDGERVTVLRFRERRLPGERGAGPVAVAGSGENGNQLSAGSGRPLAAGRGEDRPWARPQSGGELFEPLVFPAALAVELSLEGVPVVLDRGAAGNAAERVPQVIFYASGEATPGSLSFRRAATGEFLWQLRWDLLGRIEVTDDPLEAGDA